MPSIRVKHTPSSSTREKLIPDNAPRSLATIFNPTQASGLSQDGPRPQRSMPAIQATAGGSSVPRPKMRAQTVSRVHSHCTRRNSRRSSRLHDGPHFFSGTLRSDTRGSNTGLVALEGSQTDIVFRSSGEPGLVDSALSLPRSERNIDGSQEHHDDVVEHLDVIDPQVSTVSSLTNAANSILIPPLSWYSRRPVLVLASLPSSELLDQSAEGEGNVEPLEDSLDRHVEDVLTRPSKIRRTLLGIWSFLKTPMGVVTAIYGFLVVFWGGAIVIFLAKIINFHNPNLQGFWIEVSAQITNGLFTLTGIGLIPYRVLDTYHIRKIWSYKYKTKRLRAKAGLPELLDHDDLPNPIYDPNYVHVLTEEEQEDLHCQQVEFQRHQTWYRPHGSETHRAFPINIALLICLFNDGNSIFQIILCGVMWGFDRFQRPPWAVMTLIPCCTLCGITAAILIWRGSEKTKRKQEVEERLRAVLAGELPGSNTEPGQDVINGSPQPPAPCLSDKVKAMVAGPSTNQGTNNEKDCMV